VARRLAFAVLLVLACGGGLALALLPGPERAAAHESDCHVTQTCPADDGGYAWTDASGQVWVCFARDPADPSQEGATEIVHEDLTYACWAAGLTTSTETATTATTTAPTETEPTETEPTETQPEPAIPDIEYAPVAETPIGPRESVLAQRDHARAAAKAKSRRSTRPPVVLPPGGIVPRLTQGGYVFPVYGPAAFVDTFGAGRANVGWHHGEDIFAPLGAPILAVADGTLFSVGWNDIGGNRLWLRDRQGNEFYYAHLSAFSPLAVNGRAVRAGEVIGFVGRTGDAETTPPHLHFEIHPVGLLPLGYDGVVAPYPYLVAWQRLDDLAFANVGLARIGWKSLGPSIAAPTPGALLLSAADISTAASLDADEVDDVLADQPAALSGGSPLTAAPAAPETPAAGPPVSGLSRPEDAAGLLAVLRRQAEDAAAAASPAEGIWDVLSLCEAGGRWTYNGSSGFDGGLQFHPATWSAYRLPGYAEFAWQATRVQQIAVGRRVLAEQGWQAWPVCSRRLGLR
jgi:murein DD-endopeptidase MepM/ murein hydrolase activator NlpD